VIARYGGSFYVSQSNILQSGMHLHVINMAKENNFPNLWLNLNFQLEEKDIYKK
jgi:hypothetical protein